MLANIRTSSFCLWLVLLWPVILTTNVLLYYITSSTARDLAHLLLMYAKRVVVQFIILDLPNIS